MDQLSNVLLATDFSTAAQNAMEHAALIAAENDATLHVLHVRRPLAEKDWLEESAYQEMERFQERLQQLATEKLGTLQPRFQVTLKREIRYHDRIDQGILTYAKDTGCELIVLGTHGRSGLPRVFLGSVAERVVRGAPMSVLVAGEGERHALSTNDYKTILAPVDYSDASKVSLQQAAAVARVHNARLVVLHVVETSVYPSFYAPVGGPLPSETFAKIEKRSYEALKKLIEPLDVNAQPVVAYGTPQQKILSTADVEKADLVVLATEGLGGVERFLLGSVAEKVLRQSPCPVLVAKAGELNI